MIEKLSLHAGGSPQVIWIRTIGLEIVKLGPAGAVQLMEADRIRTAISTIDTDYQFTEVCITCSLHY